MNYADRGIGNY